MTNTCHPQSGSRKQCIFALGLPEYGMTHTNSGIVFRHFEFLLHAWVGVTVGLHLTSVEQTCFVEKLSNADDIRAMCSLNEDLFSKLDSRQNTASGCYILLTVEYVERNVTA